MTVHDRALLPEVKNLNTARTSAVTELPSVSVVICCYKLGRLSDVLEAIRSIHSQDIQPSELIVVADHNVELLAALRNIIGEGISLIENSGERGLSGARNTGIAYASSDLLLFLDDDAVADPSCLRQLAQRCCDHNVIGVGALIKPAWLSSPPAWFPAEFLWVVGCTYNGLKAGETRNLLGAAMCIRRDVFEKTGGFDSSLGRRHIDLPLGCEETELCIRASKAIAGGQFVYEPAAHVDHKVPTDRLSLAYFTTRCYAEGLSKAHLSHLVGTDRSLESERTYLSRTLPRAIIGNLRDVLRGDISGLGRSAAIVLGVAYTAAGFAIGHAKRMLHRADFEPSPAPAKNVSSSTVIPAPSVRKPLGLSTVRDTAVSMLRSHSVLFSNAGLLALGTGLASCLGFVYWWLAARTFPLAAVGAAAAAISLMNFIGHLGEVGLGALLIGETHRFRDRSGEFVSAALVTSGICSALFALVYTVASLAFPTKLDLGLGSAGVAFVLGCAFTGLTLVLDQALVGLLRSWLQVTRNVSFGIVKLAMLALLPMVLGAAGHHAGTILATWVVGQVASIALLLVMARDRLDSVFARPNFALLKPLLPGVAGHHGLNLANLAPGLLLPFVVTAVLSPTINAAFYAAWTMMSVAFLVPASLATVVFAVGAKNPSDISAKLRASLGLSMASGAAVAAMVYVAPDFLLGLFSPAYAQIAGPSLSVLGLSVFPIAMKYHYVSIQRLNNRMFRASLLVGFGCLLELAGAIVGGVYGGLLGLTIGWLLGLSIEAVLMAPAVLGYLMAGGSQPATVPANTLVSESMQVSHSMDRI
jgi:GT2 family glycosyltransferase/O-antigen/teichoic acid export membrane protein